MKDIGRRMTANSLANAGGMLFSKVLDLLTIALLAPYLGVADFGIFAFTFAYVSIFAIGIDWGMQLVLMRELAARPADAARLQGNALVLKLCFALLSLMLACLTIQMLDYEPAVKRLVMIASLNLLVSFRLPSFKDAFHPPLAARLKLAVHSLCSIMNRVLTFAGVGIAILLDADLAVIVAVYVLAALPAFAWLVAAAMRELPARPAVDLTVWKDLLKQGFPLAVGGMIWLLIGQLDIFLLSQLRSADEIGLYSAARRLVEPLEILSISLMMSVLPAMASAEGGLITQKRIYNRSIVLLLVLLIPAAGGIGILAEPVLSMVYGQEYLAAQTVLAVLAGYLPLLAFWQVASGALIAVRRQSLAAWVCITALGVNIGVNAWLIPNQGYLGAGISRFLTSAAMGGMGLWFVHRHIGRPDYRSLALLGGATAVLIGPASLGLRPTPAFAAGLFLYAGWILSTRLVKADEWTALLGLLRDLRRSADRPTTGACNP